MRVLLVTRAGVGGAARHVLDAVRGLAGEHEITVLLSPLEDPEFGDRVEAAGAAVERVRMPRGIRPGRDVAALVAVRRLVRVGRFDVIHAHTAKAGAIVRVAGRRTPVVYSPHGFYHHYPTSSPLVRWVARLTERRLAHRARLLAFCAEWEVAAARRDGILARLEAVVIPNGVPVPPALSEAERNDARAALGAGPVTPVVLMVGRLKSPKDPLTFLEAARRLGDAARFVLVGDGPLLGRCRGVAPPSAVLTGARDDLDRLLPAADVAVLTTDFEAAPYFLLEAMAAGLPSIATDVPGTREVLGDAGLLVPRRDPDRLAEAVRSLVEDHAARIEIGELARSRAAGRYSVERMLEATDRAWRTAVSG